MKQRICFHLFIYLCSVLFITEHAHASCDSLVINQVNVCAGSCGYYAVKVFGGTPPYTYSWSPSGATTDSVMICPPYYSSDTSVTVTDNAGCINTAKVHLVTINPLPIVITSPPAAICIGDCTTLTATGGITYSWSPSYVPPNGVVCPIFTTIYTVTVIDGNGCSNTGTTVVTVNTNLVVTISAPNIIGDTTEICYGSCVQLTAAGGTSYSWSPSTGLSCTSCSSPNACPLQTTVYTIIATNVNGCNGSSSITVKVNPLPLVITSPDTKVCKGQCRTLTANGSNIHNWMPGNLTGMSITVCPSTTTIYTAISDTDVNGCIGTSKTKVTIDPTCVPAFGGGYQPD